MNDQPELADKLNKTQFPTNSIPEDAFLIYSSKMSKEALSKLRSLLKEKFGNSAPSIPESLNGPLIRFFAYCHLQRTLPFSKEFLRPKKTKLKFKAKESQTEVEFFGSTQHTSDKYTDYTRLLHWKDESQFTLQFLTRRKGESIVLSKMDKPKNIMAAIETIKKQVNAEYKIFGYESVNGIRESRLNALGKGDVLAVPVINCKITNNFTELCDKSFTSGKNTQDSIEIAYQDLLFKMDESGATVRSSAYSDTFMGSTQNAFPRRFIFDKPFMLTLWKNGADFPYLAIWIATTDIMIPAENR